MDTGQQTQEEELNKLIETAKEKGTDQLTIDAAKALGDGSKENAIMFLRKAMEKDLQAKVAIPQDHRDEINSRSKLTILNRNGSEALRNQNREFTTGAETGGSTTDSHQSWLG